MNWKKAFTPKNTEEVRPGFFIQAKTKNPDSIEYKQVHPIVWNNKWRFNKQFSWKSIIFIILLLLVVGSYKAETQYCRELQEDPCELLPEIQNYCFNINTVTDFNLDDLKIEDDKREDTFSIQSNP